MSHSSASNPGPPSPASGSSHTPSTSPPSHHGSPGGPGQPYPPASYPGYPGYPSPYPFPPPIPGYPYPPPNRPNQANQPNIPVPPVLPPLYVPPPPRHTSLAPLWITLGVVFAVLLVVCGSCAVLAALSVTSINSEITSGSPVPVSLDPVLVAANFCAYETNKDYENAYAQLSNNLQNQLSVQQFISDNQARDATAGSVIGCSAALPENSANQAGASSTVTLTVHVWLGPETGNGLPVSKSGTMTMVQEASEWKVDAIDGALQLT